MCTWAKRRKNIYGAKWEKLVAGAKRWKHVASVKRLIHVAGAKRGKTRVGKPRLFSFYFWLVEKLV